MFLVKGESRDPATDKHVRRCKGQSYYGPTCHRARSLLYSFRINKTYGYPRNATQTSGEAQEKGSEGADMKSKAAGLAC